MQFITKIFNNYSQSPVQNTSPQLKREDWDDWVEVKGNNCNIDPLQCSQIVSATSPNGLILLEDYNSDHQMQSNQLNNNVDNVWTLSTVLPHMKGNDVDIQNHLELKNPTDVVITDEVHDNWKEEVRIDGDSDSTVVNSTNDSGHLNELIAIENTDCILNVTELQQQLTNIEIPQTSPSTPHKIQNVEIQSNKKKKNPSPNSKNRNKKKKKNSPKSNQKQLTLNNPLLSNPSSIDTSNQIPTTPVTNEQTSIINHVISTMSDTGGDSPLDLLKKVEIDQKEDHTNEIDKKDISLNDDEKNEKLEVINEPEITTGANPWHNPNEILKLRQKLRALSGEKI